MSYVHLNCVAATVTSRLCSWNSERGVGGEREDTITEEVRDPMETSGPAQRVESRLCGTFALLVYLL